jgi:Winged helix DNA-binding domain
MTVLGPRELNRALLARQLLLRRERRPVEEVVESLLGLQAQAPMPPYYGLWSRLEAFDPHELGRMLTDREVVRLKLMRSTVHLVTARDALLLRPLMQAAVERVHNGAFGRRMGGADTAELAAAVRALLDGGALTGRELGRALIERGIGDDVEAIANATNTYVPLVQLPPRGVWGRGGQARYATLEAWTGRSLEAEPSIDDVVLRYLGAFGPASVMDVQSWSGLTRLRPAGGRLLGQGFLTPEVVMIVGAELQARAEAEAAIELAKAARGAKLVEALEGFAAVVESSAEERTRGAAQVVRVLVEKGFLHEPEAEAAVEALVNEGLIESALVEAAIAEAEDALGEPPQ